MRLIILTRWFKANGWLLVLFFISIEASSQTVTINKGRFQIDKNIRLIVCNQLPPSAGTLNNQIQFDKLYTLVQPTDRFSLGQQYTLVVNDTTYTLIFTKFPLVTINTNNAAITTSTVTKGVLTLSDTLGRFGQSYIGVNVRGAYTSTLPKKPYKVQFFTDSTLRTSKDTTLLGMRTDSEWLLLAMFNEPTRINNVTSHALWLKIHQLYYLSQEPDALPGIHTRYVDVFTNNGYSGVYALTEPIDRKQLKLKKTKDNGQIRGELYKSVDWTSATLFNGITPEAGDRSTWGGFEIKYPNDTTFWSNLRGLINFVATSSEVTFKNQIAGKMQIDNLVDYFLFLNLIRATDNTGKNLYIARYKENDPYIIIPWDLDGSWGYMWAGFRDNTTNDILSNNLYNRLLSINPGGFKQKLKKRWFKLRENEFATASLKGAITNNINLLKQDGAYLREATQWPLESIDNELAYVHGWIDQRVAYLDSYFGAFLDECTNSVAPTITVSSTLITAGTSATLTASGCPYTVIWNTGQSANPLTISPSVSTQYSATCYQAGANCSSAASTPVSISVVRADSLVPSADLALTSFVSRRLVAVDEPVLMTLSLTNNGPQTAHNVRLQDRLPTGLSFVSSSETNVSYVNGIINIELDSLSADETRLIPFVVKPTTAGLFRNAAQVLATNTLDTDSQPGSGTGDGEDDMTFMDLRTQGDATAVNTSPNPDQRPLPDVLSNQPAPSSTEVDLSVELTADKRVLRPGETATLTIVVRNRGGLDAANTTLACTIPAGLNFVSGDGLSVTGNTVNAMNLQVPANGKLRLPFVVQATTTGNLICQTQVVACGQSDSDSIPGNGYETGEDDEATIDLRIIDN